MNLYNSMSNSVEAFTANNGRVGVYVCGVTPYDTTHLGHAFTFFTYDVLVRYLRYIGYDVTYVQNVTDIDDDILRKSKELGMNWRELANAEIRKFRGDLEAMHAVPFDHYVAATAHMPQVVAMVQRLVDAGVAYEAAGNVYFSVAADPDFGKLSKIAPTEMLAIANQRGNHPDDPNKRDPLDFVLWQAGVAGEPTWSSPWSEGRPGWHIECSAMSTTYLGNQIDIHGGGGDLIFPHHEAEIAQSEYATGVVPFVRYWMHCAMVEYQGEKMSKSLGNLVRISELLQRWTPDAIRLCLVNHHYREVWEFFDSEMVECGEAAALALRAVNRVSGDGEVLDSEPAKARFLAAMDDDLDTPSARAAVLDLARAIDEARGDVNVADAQATLRTIGGLLGLVFA